MTSHPGGLSSSTNILSQWRRMWQRGPACRVILFERNRQGKDMLHISHPGSQQLQLRATQLNSTQLNTIIHNTSDRIFPCPHCIALAHFPFKPLTLAQPVQEASGWGVQGRNRFAGSSSPAASPPWTGFAREARCSWRPLRCRGGWTLGRSTHPHRIELSRWWSSQCMHWK